MPNNNKILGYRIKKLRNEKNLTQEELAEQADISIKYLGEIERGRGNPTLRNLDSLASVLGLATYDLLNFGDFDKTDEELRKEIATLLKIADRTVLKLLYMALKP